MKLAALYTVFNGLELLEASVNQLDVDVVIIGYQTISNRGNKSEEVLPFIEEMKLKHPNWYFLNFEPDLSKHPNQNEINKHNLLLTLAKNLNCTHFLMSATDHFYNREDFIKAKEISKNYDATTTKMFTYYKEPTLQLTPIEDYEMLFICKLYPQSEFVRKNFPVVIDPALKISTSKSFKSFDSSDIMMHHYSMLRIDINNKFDNSCASVNWSDELKEQFKEEYKHHQEGDAVSYFKGRRTIRVNNYFNL